MLFDGGPAGITQGPVGLDGGGVDVDVVVDVLNVFGPLVTDVETDVPDEPELG